MGFKLLAAITATGLLGFAMHTYAEGEAIISFLSSKPLKPTAKCAFPQSSMTIKGPIRQLDLGEAYGKLSFEPKNVRILRSEDGFYISYYQGMQTSTRGTDVIEQPVSLMGIGNDLNDTHYFALRTPDCSGFLKVNFKGYTEQDFRDNADKSVPKFKADKNAETASKSKPQTQKRVNSTTAEGRIQ